jgi:prepilin-type N-terminal cleavage/methylation domain-containing protein
MKPNHAQSGFTLVELLVTVSLIIIFTASAATYNRTADQQIALFREQGKVVNEIYKARALAISTFNRTSSSADIPCGYGIHIESANSIVLFKEPASQRNNDCQTFPSIIYNADPTKDVEVVPLTGVSITVPDGIIDQDNSIDILFVPPDPKVYSNKSFPITLSLQATRIASPVNIEINKFGQISVQ